MKERAETTMVMHELVAACGPLVPPAVAARQWHQKHGDTYSTENQRIFAALRGEVSRYRGTAVDPLTDRRAWTLDTQFTIGTVTCRQCGVVFVPRSDRSPEFCSRKCMTRSFSQLVQPQPAPVQPASAPVTPVEEEFAELPELRALAMILRALRLLPDHTARMRALDYARDMQGPA